MSTKRIILAIVAGFIWLAGGRYLIHSVWLAGAYAENAQVWRDQRAMMHLIWVVDLACLLFAVAAVLIYVRGLEAKPWLGQGFRFGILLALATTVPQSMIEYFTYPVPAGLMVYWIIGEGGLVLLLGVIVAAICRPQSPTT
jgi:hypothetical protein